MATPRTSPRSARTVRTVKPKAGTAKVKAKRKTKARPKAAPKSKVKAARKTPPSAAKASAKLRGMAQQARKAAGPEIQRLKKASVKVEARLKEVSKTVASKLADFEDIAEQQLKSEKNKARLDKIEKDVGRLISSADQQFGKARVALDKELKDIKSQLEKSAEKVIPAAKERISALVADLGSDDTWEFYTEKSGKWRWRLKDGDGKTVGASNKAFKTRAECTANAKRLRFRG